jgi:hypothetical protein
MLSKRGCRKRYGSSQSRTHMHMYLLPAASSKNSPERPARGIQIEVQELPFSGQNWFQMRRRGMHDGEGGHMHQLAAGGGEQPVRLRRSEPECQSCLGGVEAKHARALLLHLAHLAILLFWSFDAGDGDSPTSTSHLLYKRL